jgi:hypothetical protein
MRYAFSVIAGAVLLTMLAAWPARAATTGLTPGQQIAAALQKSPLYVDPSLDSAFSATVRSRLLQEIREAPVPVYILAVPLVSGGQWSSGEQLATVVQNYLGRPGIYLTPDEEFGGNIDAFTWPSDPQGTGAAPYNAADAAQAVNLASDAESTTLADKFFTCIQLVTSGKAVSAYNAATRQLNQATSADSNPQPSGSGGISAILITVIALIVVAGGACGLVLARRGRRRHSPFIQPRAVFATARTASESELREQAQRQVIALGEAVENLGRDDQSEQVRALDAYEAAGRVLDRSKGVCDLVGVLVLTHLGFNAAQAVRAVQDGKPAPEDVPLCFFNPLHGDAPRPIRWRPLGSTNTLDVHVCDDCASMTGRHLLPDTLTDIDGDRTVPYYEVDPERSVWAATGYGQFGDDIVRRILTGAIR